MIKSLKEKARAGLESMIVFNHLETDTLYSEKQLANLLNLGRTPVREALQTLAYDCMLRIYPRKGIQIIPLDVDDQLKVLEIRDALEGACINYAALRADLEQKKIMRSLARALIEAAALNNDLEVLNCLRDIHDMLMEATQNPFFAQIMSPLLSLSRRFWFMNKTLEDSKQGALFYKEILISVAEGDADGAVSAAKDLMAYLKKFAKRQKE